jgi:hypothetical protein
VTFDEGVFDGMPDVITVRFSFNNCDVFLTQLASLVELPLLHPVMQTLKEEMKYVNDLSDEEWAEIFEPLTPEQREEEWRKGGKLGNRKQKRGVPKNRGPNIRASKNECTCYSIVV